MFLGNSSPDLASDYNQKSNIVLLLEMLTHSSSLKIIAMLALMLSGLSTSPVVATDEAGFSTLIIHLEDGTVASYSAYPGSTAKLLFPSGEATLEQDSIEGKWSSPRTGILKTIQTFRVSDRNRRFNAFGVTWGERLFIFDGVFAAHNAVTMSQLIRATDSAPRDETQALSLVEFYVALSYYRLEDPSRFVAVGSDGSPKNGVFGDGKNISAMMGISHSPQVTRDGANYTVDFYAFEPREVTPTRVNRWRITVGPEGLEEHLCAHNESFGDKENSATGAKGKPNGKVRFKLMSMGNGSTKDGATTDIQIWAASDGSGFLESTIITILANSPETGCKIFSRMLLP